MFGSLTTESGLGRTKGTTELCGRWTLIVRRILRRSGFNAHYPHPSTAQTRFLISGSADNTLKLWSVQTGKCLYTWEFPTAVKRVAFNAAGTQVVCITEQRMGFQCAIRVFDINPEGDGTKRRFAAVSAVWFANGCTS